MNRALQPVTVRFSAEDVARYCALTGDFNPMHLDADFAARTPLGRLIIHGTLTLNAIWMLIARNFGRHEGRAMLNLRFVAPVGLDEPVTASGEETEPGVWALRIANEAGEVKVAATFRPGGAA